MLRGDITHFRLFVADDRRWNLIPADQSNGLPTNSRPPEQYQWAPLVALYRSLKELRFLIKSSHVRPVWMEEQRELQYLLFNFVNMDMGKLNQNVDCAIFHGFNSSALWISPSNQWLGFSNRFLNDLKVLLWKRSWSTSSIYGFRNPKYRCLLFLNHLHS